MNWEAVGAVGEIVGALAVVLSLVYLSVQIRDQNRESRVASIHEVLEGFRAEIAAFRDPQLARLLDKGARDFEALSDPERIQFVALIQGPLRFWEEAYYQYREHRLGVHLWDGINAQMRDFVSTEGSQKVWALRRHTYSEDFRRHVEAAEPGAFRTS